MNLYRFHDKSKTLHKHDEAQNSVIPVILHKITQRQPLNDKQLTTVEHNAKLAYNYVKYIRGGKRWLLGEKAIATDPEYAYYYAEYMVQKRWPLGEKAIATDPKYAYYYTVILQKRWPPGEKAIATSPKYAYLYAENRIQKRWPPGEKAIATDSTYAFYYATEIIQDKWPPGEKAIVTDRDGKRLYNDMLTKKGYSTNEHI